MGVYRAVRGRGGLGHPLSVGSMCALAVGLGLGGAIAAMPAVAVADTGGPSGSSGAPPSPAGRSTVANALP